MKFSSTHVVSVFTLACLLVASFSYTSSVVAGINTAADNQSEDSTQNQSPQNPQAEVKSPLRPPTGFVNDYVNLISPESKARLESLLKELTDKAEIDFKVVVIETTGGQPIFDYSLAVARGWSVRAKGGGALLMLAVKDRTWRLQITRGLEKDLPNEVLKEIEGPAQELYRQGKLAEGIEKYVKAIIQRLEEIRGFKLSGQPAR